jgi:hypothetical protein
MHDTWRFYVKQGEDLKHKETFHVDRVLYSLHELRQLITHAYNILYASYDAVREKVERR